MWENDQGDKESKELLSKSEDLEADDNETKR